MAVAAAQMASAISESKQKSLIVFDFSGPEGKVTLLGQNLADDFSAELEKSAKSFRVEKRSLISDEIRQYRYTPEFVVNPVATLTIAASLQVETFVTGRLSVEGDKLSVSISAYRVHDAKGIKGFRVTWPLTEETRDLIKKDLTEAAPPSDGANLPAAGKNRYSVPRCIQCPLPPMAGTQAVVLLELVVRKDGTVGGIRVLRGVRPDVNEKLIDAVEQWKLYPAKGPDGKPAAVRQEIQINLSRDWAEEPSFVTFYP